MTQDVNKHTLNFTILQENDIAATSGRPAGAEGRKFRWADRNFRQEAPEIFKGAPYKFLLCPRAPAVRNLGGGGTCPASSMAPAPIDASYSN